MSASMSSRAIRKEMAAQGSKPCLGCGKIKRLSGFHTQATGVGGRTARCIECANIRVLANRNADRENANAQGREWYARNKEKRGLSISAYQKSAKGKAVRRASSERSKRNYPEKASAHAAVRQAIKSGLLHKASSCAKCGSHQHIQGHHDDYSKPLEVTWLCVPCHVRLHIERGDR